MKMLGFIQKIRSLWNMGQCLVLFAVGLPIVLIAQPDSVIPLALQTHQHLDGTQARQNFLSFMSAKSAMDFGFSSIAEEILKNLLIQESALDLEVLGEVKDCLVLAYLNQSKIREALAVFDKLKEEDSTRYPFLKLLLLYHQDAPVSEISASLDAVQDMNLGADQPWVDMIRGVLLGREGRAFESKQFLDKALNDSVNTFQRSWIESLIWREEILRGISNETLAISLKTQIQNAVNPLVVSQLVQQYAIVLVGLGREHEAMQEVEIQLSILTEDLREQKDRLMMFLALLSGRESGKAKVVIEELLLNGRSERIRSMAFYYWLSSMNPGSDKDTAFLNQLMGSRPHDQLKNEILYVLAMNSFYRGDLESSRDRVDAVLEASDNAQLRESSLRVLVGICWSQNPPQYRLAAEHLLRLQGMVTGRVEQERLSLLVADSYFLNGDYENALPYYHELIEVESLVNVRDEVLYKLTSCYLALGNADGARPLLDEFQQSQDESRELVWGSEWNFNLKLLTQGRSSEAIQRLKALKASFPEFTGIEEDWLYAAQVRVGWLLGFLYFQDQEYQECVRLCEETIGKYNSFVASHKEELGVIRDELQLLNARALFSLEKGSLALELLYGIREIGNEETAASTFMIEARHYWSHGDMFNAQRALIRLADQYPSSQYAPVALYEAAMNVESRGNESSDQEAILLYERISSDFPDHSLHFISKLRQGDLLRKSNQFALAIPFYESLLSEFRGDDRLYLVEMALGESYLALGSTRVDYIDDAVRILERVFDLNNLPVEVRLEAGTKAATGLLKVNRNYRAQELLWRVFSIINEEPEASDQLGASGRYWLARAALMLSEHLIQNGEQTEVYRLVYMLERMNLPGVNLIKNRL